MRLHASEHSEKFSLRSRVYTRMRVRTDVVNLCIYIARRNQLAASYERQVSTRVGITRSVFTWPRRYLTHTLWVIAGKLQAYCCSFLRYKRSPTFLALRFRLNISYYHRHLAFSQLQILNLTKLKQHLHFNKKHKRIG